MRCLLRCDDPRFRSLSGNKLLELASDLQGANDINGQFEVSSCSMQALPLRLERFAAYSLNHLHVGAPRLWTVMRPEDYGKLEQYLLQCLDPVKDMQGVFLGKPKLATPGCSQFIRHHRVYLPEATINALGVRYTKVTQRPGELVITFPYAYHQGMNSGPNIMEVFPYGSDRWQIFVRNGLYQHCTLTTCGHDGNLPCGVTPQFEDTINAKPARTTVNLNPPRTSVEPKSVQAVLRHMRSPPAGQYHEYDDDVESQSPAPRVNIHDDGVHVLERRRPLSASAIDPILALQLGGKFNQLSNLGNNRENVPLNSSVGERQPKRDVTPPTPPTAKRTNNLWVDGSNGPFLKELEIPSRHDHKLGKDYLVSRAPASASRLQEGKKSHRKRDSL